MWKRLFLLIFILLSFEVGFFLIVVPWSNTWEDNFFIRSAPFPAFWFSPFLRGAVSGLGLVNIFMGLGEAWHFRERLRQMKNEENATPQNQVQQEEPK